MPPTSRYDRLVAMLRSACAAVETHRQQGTAATPEGQQAEEQLTQALAHYLRGAEGNLEGKAMAKVYCYYLPFAAEAGSKTVSPMVVYANEPGYWETDFIWPAGQAEAICREMNRKLGLTEDQVSRIVASSMFGVPYVE